MAAILQPTASPSSSSGEAPGRPWMPSFSSLPSAIVSGLMVLALAWCAWKLLRWGVIDAVVRPDAAACREALGACWGVIVEKHPMVLLGRFPSDERWRPIVGCLVLLSTVGAAGHPRLFGRVGLILVLAGLVVFGVLMAGGVAGLTPVGTDLWGGLPLTLFLAIVACLVGVPLGIALAMARRSTLPVLRVLSTVYIETVRGVPLVTLLFFGAFVLPLLLPAQLRLDPMLRIGVCLAFFCTAYLAEVFRGGLQSVPRGQFEAAHALGLNRWQMFSKVVLPQALRVSIAPATNNFIGALKDTSLVAIVNVYDLTGSLRLAMGDAQWHSFFLEMYLMICAVYLVLGASIAQYGRYLSKRYALN